MSTPPAIEAHDLRHEYGRRAALTGVTFSVRRGELFGLLGPNGGGKTTLFRILSTLLPPTSGEARIFGLPVRGKAAEVRRHLGVVFQHPSLDPQLTALENLLHHGNLYGLSGAELRRRSRELLERLGLAGRERDRARILSGGLQRRVELAKGLLPRPELLLLDEPSTGLDPGARRELLQILRRLTREEGVTVALTTHYMDEAERCDRVAILDEGRLIALDSPENLKGRIPGDVVVVEARDPEALAPGIRARFGLEPVRVDGSLRLERARGHELLRELVEAFPNEILSAAVGRPTLEDVFVHLTGRRFDGDESQERHESRAPKSRERRSDD